MNSIPFTKNSGLISTLPWLGLALILLIIDQLTKILILDAYHLGEGMYVSSFFNIVRVHNLGAAFSFLASESGWQRWFFTAIGVIAAIFIVWLLKSHSEKRLFSLALACILGGALGNVIDRVLYGYVVDFLDFHYANWHFPAFNIADSGITTGAALLILDEFLRMRSTQTQA